MIEVGLVKSSGQVIHLILELKLISAVVGLFRHFYNWLSASLENKRFVMF